MKVRYVEDITNSKRVDRELVMLKVAAAAGEQRTEVMQFCDIFRAKVVDVADDKITVSVVGDPGKVRKPPYIEKGDGRAVAFEQIAAFESSLSKFGICELVRTGTISLKRGEHLLEPLRNDSKRPESKKAQKTTKYLRSLSPVIVCQSKCVDRKTAKEIKRNSTSADVYIVEDDVGGVWEVEDVVDNMEKKEDTGYEPYTIQIEVDNTPGVLNQVDLSRPLHL